MGVFILNRAEAYKPMREYGLTVFFQSVPWGLVQAHGFDVSTPELKSKWANVIIQFRLAQTKYVCPTYNISLPRLLGYAKLTKDGRSDFFILLVNLKKFKLVSQKLLIT